MSVQVVVLCAGKGTRMKSEKAKVMHEIMGQPMSKYIYDLAKEISDKKPIFVVGYKKEQIQDYYKDTVNYTEQKEQLGTGHAVMITKEFLNPDDDILILCGDTPLVKKESIEKIIENNTGDAVIISSIVENPFGYGRIIKDSQGRFEKIIEEKDADDSQRMIREINSGMYLVKGNLILENIDKLSNDNAKGEYYLTDLFEILKKQDKKISVENIDKEEIFGINTRAQLEEARLIIQKRINAKHMEDGVTLIDPLTIYIEKDVSIGKDTVIYPHNVLTNGTVVGENCIIYYENKIINSQIADDVVLKCSFIEDSFVGESTTVGPYAHLRPNSKLGKKVKIGNFVEVKNSSMDDGSKASHLSYVGDAGIGKKVNIGCGVIFVNYDGKKKQRSVVKDNAFIGSNSNLVAPVTVEEKGYVAAGSTITKDVPAGALCVSRARQVIKLDWSYKKGLLD
ncbi:UDP-N-acetylglucosamine diphosphorylase/glucosamine-1-phosphate N-acetyltransferase [[Eubacterium] yurii subsp. margaretiae ATCC 43715]|nr:UDP-N-acetylglucosamine diphosphorylase/glucosamine-1-phosphate N-acetyltransferase [[Eubacterium] yurii subsp. margaretiae ATCC 43715]